MLSVNVDLSAVSVVGFQSTTYTVNEGDEFDLVIELQDNITQPLMINVHTEDDSAVSTSDGDYDPCLLYTSPSPRDATLSRMPSSA